MTRRLLIVLLALVLASLPLVPVAAADDGMRVLVYSRTTGYRHASIPAGIAAIQRLGDEHGFAVDATEDSGWFTDAILGRYDVVVFLNTTSDVVHEEGQAAFERYVRGGGGWVGIHSAADSEYEWPFYGLLLGGAWFRTHPLVNQSGTIVNEAPDEPATAHLPERWSIEREEFYSFQQSPRDRVRVLLSIDESSYLQDPHSSCLLGLLAEQDLATCSGGSMGPDHPMSWCVTIDEGKGFYTALGHIDALYGNDDYLAHLWGGIQTAAQLVDADCGPPVTGEGVTPPSTPSPDPGEVDSDTLGQPVPGTPSTGGGAGLAALVVAAAALSRRRRIRPA